MQSSCSLILLYSFQKYIRSIRFAGVSWVFCAGVKYSVLQYYQSAMCPSPTQKNDQHLLFRLNSSPHPPALPLLISLINERVGKQSTSPSLSCGLLFSLTPCLSVFFPFITHCLSPFKPLQQQITSFLFSYIIVTSHSSTACEALVSGCFSSFLFLSSCLIFIYVLPLTFAVSPLCGPIFSLTNSNTDILIISE